MKLWFLLLLTFIVQEPISTSAVLLHAYQLHYNVWIIHLLFTLATLGDIIVTYYVGKFLYKKSATTSNKFLTYLHKKFDTFSKILGKKGKIVTLIVFVPTIFPISGFLIPWLGISLIEALIMVFIGEVLFWYAYEWVLVLGVKNFAEDSHVGIYIVIAISIVISLSIAYAHKKIQKQP